MCKVLITGAAGFVGANLLRSLLSEGAKVIAVVRKDSNLWRLGGLSNYDIEEADLLDAKRLLDIFKRHKPSQVYHLGTHGAYPRQKGVHKIFETNLIGSFNVIDAAKVVCTERLLYLGSSGEYGFVERPISEEDGLNPNSYYAVGKAAASLLFRYEASVSSGLCIRIARLFSAYGPFEDPLRLMPQVVFHGLRGALPPSLGDPNSARDYLYVGDLVQALRLLMNWSGGSGGEVINIASGTQTRLCEVIDMAKNEFNIDATPVWGEHAKAVWDTKNWQADVTKARNLLGWSPEVSLLDGLRKFSDSIRWSKGQQEHYERILSNNA